MAAKTTLSPSEIANLFAGREFVQEVGNFLEAQAAAGVVYAHRIEKKCLLRAVRMRAGVCGSAGQTDGTASVNGVAVPGIAMTIVNTDTDGTELVDQPTAETILNPGDLLTLETTAVATALADFSMKALLVEVFS